MRRPASRLALSTQRLVARLRDRFPRAAALARDPSLAERSETSPYDHLAADAIIAARSLLVALAALDRPVVLLPSPTQTLPTDD